MNVDNILSKKFKQPWNTVLYMRLRNQQFPPYICHQVLTLEYISRASTNFSVLIKLFPSVFSLSASSLSAAEGGDFFCN